MLDPVPNQPAALLSRAQQKAPAEIVEQLVAFIDHLCEIAKNSTATLTTQL